MKLKGKIVESDLSDLNKEEYSSGHHKIPRIWIVVADSAGARIFKKNSHGLELIGEATPKKTEREKGTPNRSLGRISSSGGASIHHRLEPHLPPGRHDATTFTHDLSQWLEQAVQENAFDRLVLVAAPKTLGDLRKQLGEHVQARIMAEVNKELTKMPEKALLEELKEIVWF